MRTLDLDWELALEDLARWDRLSFDAQAFCLAGPANDSAEVSALPSELVEELVESGWCELTADDRRIQRRRERRPVLVALRAMVRAPVLHAAAEDSAYSRRDPRGTSLDNYLVEHCSEEDLERLGNLQAEGRLHIAAKLASSSWILAFLRRDQPGALAPARRERYAKVPEPVLELVDKLIRVLLQQGAPWALGEAYESLVGQAGDGPGVGGPAGSRSSHRLFAQALHFALREALVLISLDDELTPFLGLWPNALHSIRKRQAAESVDAVARAEPSETWVRAQLADDLAVLLTECASSPPRIKANRRELFAKATNQLSERLEPIPRWLQEPGYSAAQEERVHRALGLAIGFGLARAAGRAGKDLRLVVTDTGREWLAHEAGERLSRLIRLLRRDGDPVDGAERGRTLTERADEFDEDDIDEDSFDSTRLLPHRPYHYFLWNIDFVTPTLDAFRQVSRTASKAREQPGSESWYDIERFLQQKGSLNPIEEHLSPERLRWLGEHQAGRMWLMVLASFFFERLVTLGGAELGVVDGRLAFRLTSAADLLLGLSDELDLPAAAAEERVLIQPNFEVVFLTPAPLASVELASLAERKEEGPLGDRVGTLFELTKGSIQRAASSGISGEQLIARLEKLSAEPLPGNVVEQVKLWCADLHWVKVRRATVIQCPSPEAAAAVLGALGRAGKLLADDLVELDSNRLSEAQRRRLREAGVFFDED